MSPVTGDPVASLSMREFQVFCKLAAGAEVGDIAQQLGLSAKTVSTYRTRVFDKLGLASNEDLRKYAGKRVDAGVNGDAPVAASAPASKGRASQE
jgi:DNA-binding NarL/FixJ family response regulator